MDPGERKGWMKIISAEELDSHMAAIGQAEANADIVKQMFAEYPLQSNSRMLIAGCGTAQLLDYIRPSDFGSNIELVLTDINPSFLAKARERLKRFPGINYTAQEDDIEDTKLSGTYDGALVVLVLQHVEWHKALDSLVGLNPSKFYIIEQEQDPSQHAVTKSRQLSEAWRRYAKVANPHLIQRKELTDYLAKKGYEVIGSYERAVLDNKIMYGSVFEKIINTTKTFIYE